MVREEEQKPLLAMLALKPTAFAVDKNETYFSKATSPASFQSIRLRYFRLSVFLSLLFVFFLFHWIFLSKTYLLPRP